MNMYMYSYFFLLAFTPSKAEQPPRGIELQEKEAQKRLQHTGNLFRKNLQSRDVNSRLKATQIIGQRKAFCRQTIPEFSCARK